MREVSVFLCGLFHGYYVGSFAKLRLGGLAWVAGYRGLGSLCIPAAVVILKEVGVFTQRWMYVGLACCMAVAAAVDVWAQCRLRRARRAAANGRPIELL